MLYMCIYLFIDICIYMYTYISMSTPTYLHMHTYIYTGALQHSHIKGALEKLEGSGAKLFKQASLSCLSPYPLTQAENRLCQPNNAVLSKLADLVDSRMAILFPPLRAHGSALCVYVYGHWCMCGCALVCVCVYIYT